MDAKSKFFNFNFIFTCFRKMKIRGLDIPKNFDCGIVGDHLLVKGYAIHLVKIDYNSCEVSHLSSFNHSFGGQLIFDQLDKRNFLVCSYRNGNVQTGQVSDEQIQLNVIKQLGVNGLFSLAMSGNKLRGFRYVEGQNASSLKFYNIDLNTLKHEKMDAPVIIENQSDAISRIKASFFNLFKI